MPYAVRTKYLEHLAVIWQCLDAWHASNITLFIAVNISKTDAWPGLRLFGQMPCALMFRRQQSPETQGEAIIQKSFM